MISSVKNILLYLLYSSDTKYSIRVRSILFRIETIEITTATIINKVCNVSVQTIVLIPPLYVYTHIKPIDIPTVNGKGIFQLSKTNFCKTIATKNSLKDAPNNLEIKK